MNILLATSFHEQLVALPGFHLNWQAALSGRMTTVAHLSETTRRTMLAEMAEHNIVPSATGLVINPVSIPTRFGSALPMLIHNHQSATRMGIEATHICLASPYLYALQPGLDDAIEHFECGLPATTYEMHENWHWHDIVARDTRMTALAKHLGTKIRIGRADGVFMTNTLFKSMINMVLRFFSPDEIANLDPVYPLEEVLFPTILPALLGNAARIGTTRARVWEPGDPPTPNTMRAAIASGLHASAKRISQMPGNPVRDVVLANLPGKLVLNARLGTNIA